jgi:hypothetical protein
MNHLNEVLKEGHQFARLSHCLERWCSSSAALRLVGGSTTAASGCDRLVIPAQGRTLWGRRA